MLDAVRDILEVGALKLQGADWIFLSSCVCSKSL